MLSFDEQHNMLQSSEGKSVEEKCYVKKYADAEKCITINVTR